MTEQKYEGYSTRAIMLEGLGDALKAQMLKLWTIAMAAQEYERKDGSAGERVREGIRKAHQAYERGRKAIMEMVPE